MRHLSGLVSVAVLFEPLSPKARREPSRPDFLGNYVPFEYNILWIYAARGTGSA